MNIWFKRQYSSLAYFTTRGISIKISITHFDDKDQGYVECEIENVISRQTWQTGYYKGPETEGEVILKKVVNNLTSQIAENNQIIDMGKVLSRKEEK